MAGSAPHQSPLGPLGAPARARRARRVGVGGARGSRRPPTPMRIPRRARGAHARGARRDPLHALPTVCAGGVTPNPLRPDHERDEHAARGRGDGTVRGSRPRTWGAHDGHGNVAYSRSWLILPPHHHNLRHLRAAPRRRRERAATGPPGPRAARRPSRSLGPHMARERTHRRRRGARVPSHCVAHTPAHPAPHKRSKVHAGRSRPGCVTVAGRLPRRRAEPGVHLPPGTCPVP